MKNTFHIEFAESLGLCLFCNCSGDDNSNLIGVWDSDRRVFVEHESVHTPSGELDLFKDAAFCSVCKEHIVPRSMADASIVISLDSRKGPGVYEDSPPSWVGFTDKHIILHLRQPESAQTVAGLLEWCL